MTIKENAQELVQNPKIASTVSAATTGTGLGTMFDWVPNLGELATIIGIVLSIVLIYTHWRKGRIEYKKTQLEISILMEKEAERLENANRRKEEAHL